MRLKMRFLLLLLLPGLAAPHPALAGTARSSAPEPVQFSFQWMYIEGGQGSMGFTMDDFVLEWDETHPVDQAASNSCANLPQRPNEPGICEAGTTPGIACVTGATGGCEICVSSPSRRM